MQVLTNKIDPIFDYEKIDNDFDIFKIIVDNSDLDKKVYPGELANDFAKFALIESVCFIWGNTFYIMFRKNEFDEKQVNNLTLKANFQVQKLNVYNIYPNVLSSLFLNALYRREKYSNTLGNLYYCYKAIDDNLYALQFKIDYNGYLQINHQTFKKYNKNYPNKKTKYFYDEKKKQLCKCADYSRDTNLLLYYKKGEKNKRNNMTYFGFKTYSAFENSKMGYLYKVLKHLDIYFGQYMKMNFKISEFQTFSKNMKQKRIDIKKRFENIIINIDDTILTSESSEVCDNLVKYLEYNNFNVIRGQDNCKFNIRIIYPKENYKDGNDPHNDTLDGIYQHVYINTLKSIKEKQIKMFNNFEINRILLELLVKSDIENNKISIVDYSDYNSDMYIFIKVANISDDNKIKEYISYELTVFPDGKFEYRSVPFYNSEYCNYFLTKNCKVNSSVEGIIHNITKNRVHIVNKFGESIIPDTKGINEMLLKYNPNKYISKEIFIKYLKQYAYLYNKDEQLLSHLISQLDNSPKIECLNNIKLPKTLKKFNEYFYNNTGIMLTNLIRNNKLFPNMLTGFKKLNYRIEDDNCISYYNAPESPLQLMITKGYPIRTVSNISEEEFLLLARFMYADFVRFGSTSVLPFQFKYLRDIIDQQNKMNI